MAAVLLAATNDVDADNPIKVCCWYRGFGGGVWVARSSSFISGFFRERAALQLVAGSMVHDKQDCDVA